MIKLIAVPMLAAALSAAAIANANAWTRSGSASGPRGTVTTGGSGGCAGGACSWQGGGTGPNGGSWSRSGSGSCSGGSCNVSGQGTGPRGNSYSYGGSVSR